MHERGEPRRTKQTTAFDILQLGLIRVINCCSFASGMKCTKPKTSGSMELEGRGRSHQPQLARKAPVPSGSGIMLPHHPHTPCHNHTFPGPTCCHGPGLQLHGLTHTSLHPRESPGATRHCLGAFWRSLRENSL